MRFLGKLFQLPVRQKAGICDFSLNDIVRNHRIAIDVNDKIFFIVHEQGAQIQAHRSTI